MLSASNMFLVFVGRNYRVDVVGSWAALLGQLLSNPSKN